MLVKSLGMATVRQGRCTRSCLLLIKPQPEKRDSILSHLDRESASLIWRTSHPYICHCESLQTVSIRPADSIKTFPFLSPFSVPESGHCGLQDRERSLGLFLSLRAD